MTNTTVGMDIATLRKRFKESKVLTYQTVMQTWNTVRREWIFETTIPTLYIINIQGIAVTQPITKTTYYNFCWGGFTIRTGLGNLVT